MAIERKWDRIPPRAFVLNGGADGAVYLASTRNFKVKQKVAVEATGLPTLLLEIKRVVSPTKLIVGQISSKMSDRQDLSGYSLDKNPTIRAEEQDRSGIPNEQHERAVYAEEPIMAKRVIQVDEFGDYYSEKNPIPVSIPYNEDSFGRIKTAQPQLLFDSSFQYSLQEKVFVNQVFLSGLVAHDPVRAAARLSCSSTLNSKARFRSRNYFPYSPAFTNTVTTSFNFNGSDSGIIKRIGLYDDKNGFFLQSNNSVIQLGVRSSVSGSAVDNLVDQKKWNRDTLDGSGPSGKKLNFGLQQIMYLQYQWLGSGSVFFGFIIDGKIIIAHEFQHANILSSLYSQTGTLPIFCEIINNGGGASFMEFTCCSLVTNGAVSQHGHLHTISNNLTPKTLSIVGTSYPIISVRKRNGYSNVPVQILDLNVFSTSQDDFLIQVIHKPTLVGASWVTIPNSLCEKDVSATSWSGGEIVAEFYMKGNTQPSERLEMLSKFWDLTLGDDLAGNSEIMSITAIPLSTNALLYGVISFKEFE